MESQESSSTRSFPVLAASPTGQWKNPNLDIGQEFAVLHDSDACEIRAIRKGRRDL